MSAAVDFETQVQPILTKRCLGCHREGHSLGNVRLDSKAALMQKALVVAGKPEQSVLYQVLELPPGKPKAMPPGRQLAKADRDVIRQWIAEGAIWPEGRVLTMSSSPAPAKAAAPAKDEHELVKQLHARIVANTKEKTEADMKPYKVTIPNSDATFEMVPIPGGEFVMGTPESEAGRKPDEGPQRKVKISPFWMGKYEVTWDEYRLFMFSQLAKEDINKDPLVDAISRPTRPYVEMSFGMGINGYPAISMTQHAANKFAEWVSAKTGHFYRLPTEAEWEYACRAGTTTAYSFGDDPSQLGDYAWYADNSEGKYQKVGTKKPNPWGLHDMHGNVMEWTLDQYDPSGYRGLPDVDPWRVSTEPYPQSVRGGSWMDPASRLRCGARVGSDPSWKQQDPQLPKSIWYHTDAQGLGLRLVRPLRVPSAEEMYKYWNSGVEHEP
ncbi:MAG: SUMF1/EgtB/PvdO family nonheme iron enzyme [Bryobacteraceae bacterium]|nr:SUMF1/EgtB/PvdO family nonheme iron enzyme [Bryobacteraceae bacterium]